MTTTPPFRADHVGSYLRPPTLMDARRQRDEGQMSDDELREVENTHIRQVVASQEEVGLRGITDGEFRRLFFHVDFLEHLDGVTVEEGNFLATFRKDDGTEVGFRPRRCV